MLRAVSDSKKRFSVTNNGGGCMSDSVKRPPPIDEALLDRFKQSVKERYGRVRGHYSSELETALEEYLNAAEGGDTHDRLTEIERNTEAILAELRENEDKKKKQTSSTVQERAKKIAATIHDESDGAPKVHEAVVEAAIREHGGGSDPTIRQYKRLLKEERELFPDLRPTESYWFRDPPTFCTAMNQAVKHREIDEDTYTQALEQDYNRDWWGEQVTKYEQRENDNTGKGFQ